MHTDLICYMVNVVIKMTIPPPKKLDIDKFMNYLKS